MTDSTALAVHKNQACHSVRDRWVLLSKDKTWVLTTIVFAWTYSTNWKHREALANVPGKSFRRWDGCSRMPEGSSYCQPDRRLTLKADWSKTPSARLSRIVRAPSPIWFMPFANTGNYQTNR